MRGARLPFSTHDRAFSLAQLLFIACLYLYSSGPSQINLNIFSYPVYKKFVVRRQKRGPLDLLTYPDRTQARRCPPLKTSQDNSTGVTRVHRIAAIIEHTKLQFMTRLCLLRLLHFRSSGQRDLSCELIRCSNMWSNTQSRIIIARYVYMCCRSLSPLFFCSYGPPFPIFRK
jgi:hypothetical protein